eukprot:1142226-Pelagomonas_calceolata.AAC.1
MMTNEPMLICETQTKSMPQQKQAQPDSEEAGILMCSTQERQHVAAEASQPRDNKNAKIAQELTRKQVPTAGACSMPAWIVYITSKKGLRSNQLTASLG